MAKPNIIIPTNLKTAIDAISGYIREYEKHYEMGTDSKEWQRNKRDFENRLIAGLEVLSAVTGCEYHWTRRDLPNGKLYSGVCRAVNGEAVEVYDNCTEVLKGGAYNG